MIALPRIFRALALTKTMRLGSEASMNDLISRPPTSHLVIAGTGRAGTSFLVRYLTELGLDTTLTRRGEAGWNEAANAGLEELLTTGSGDHLPYVVKSPWSGEYVEQILANPHISVEAFLVPVRDLVEAATSRTVLEMRDIHENNAWMAELDRSWEVWATTPGGVVYSLNPLDQARLLAVSFHNLVWRATEAEVPVHFLAFPRLIEDKEYLFRAIRPVLPVDVTPERAYEAHARSADSTKVRVGDEIVATLTRREAELPLPEEVDMIALRRELVQVRTKFQKAAAEEQRSSDLAAELQSELQRAKEEASHSAGEGKRMAEEVAELRAAIAVERARAERANIELKAMRDSRIWRSTAPIRSLVDTVKGNR